MAAPDLAPRHASKQLSCTDNPFASPIVSTYTLTAPPPCAHPHSHRQHHDRRPFQPRPAGERSDSKHESGGYYPQGAEYKSGSMSSTVASSIMSPMSSIDLEKANTPREHNPNPQRSSRQSSPKRPRPVQDPEKAMSRASPHGSFQGHTHVRRTLELDDDEQDDVDEGRATQEQKAVQILLFLSGPCVLLSTINALWAIIALFITALSQPIRICAKRPSFGQQLAGLLGPTLNLQLRSIYTPLPPHANEDLSYHNGMLLIVHLLSPFVSFAIIFAAWVLAVYWLCSGMVGDPAGQDKRDDGKETVLGLRNFWERWLMRSVKME